MSFAGIGLVNIWDYLEGPNKVYELAGKKKLIYLKDPEEILD